MLDLMPSWREFALTLFRTRDADPGYVALAGAEISKAQRCRFAVAWCTYYHLGIAAKASELKGEAFWKYLDDIYDTAPRASERRHFRGQAGKNALLDWALVFGEPEMMAVRFFQARPTYEDVRRLVRPTMQMGDYFVWKWCDLYEVILGVHVDCTSEFAAKHSPPTPQDGAKAIFPDLSAAEAYRQIKTHLQENNITAPPHHKRPADINEAETVCCVYKQMVSGKYDYGLRTAKAVKRLSSVDSRTAHMMIDVLTAGHWSAAELEQIYARHH